MKKIGVIISLVLSFFILASASVAFGQTTPDVSGSKKSSDYQPPTGNPQGSVGTGYQNTESNLQPLPNQVNLSQPVLSGSADLQVAGSTGSPNRNTTTAGNEKVRYPRNILPFVVIGLLTLAGVLYSVLKPNDQTTSANEVSKVEDVKPEVVTIKPKKAGKKTAKKKPTKKRKK